MLEEGDRRKQKDENFCGIGNQEVPTPYSPQGSTQQKNPGPDGGFDVLLREPADPVTWAPTSPAGAHPTLVLLAPLLTPSQTRWLLPNVSSFQTYFSLFLAPRPGPAIGAYGIKGRPTSAISEALTFHLCTARGQFSA